MLDLIQNVRSEEPISIAHQQGVKDQAVLHKLLLLGVTLGEVKPFDNENLVEVSERFLVDWLLQVEEEREKDI